jgi:adenine-specific DNA-methyltransferase
LIESDNYHALQLLEYLYAGKVDCIYIDPPYNTGARDWKYNNDYVDSADSYRHSKWLSMMQKRLRLAKNLLNPKDSVLIVTIDEKEYLHLGCLLEEMFSGADIQMISSVINPKGSAREGRFSRVDEYIFFVFIGSAVVIPQKTDMLREIDESEKREVRWAGLMRNGEGSRRTQTKSLFYPIYFDIETGNYVSAGDPVPLGVNREDVPVPEGQFAVWPLDKSGQEMKWRLYPPTFREYVKKGYVRFGEYKKGSMTRSISYLQDGMLKKIESGDIVVKGVSSEGALEVEYLDSLGTRKPATIWNMTSHSASEHGSSFIKNLLNERKFTYPKSLYAVVDTIRFVTANKPNALIIDFFAGSGTTLHAVNLLNYMDGGNRRCILVTNNEVSDEDVKKLTKNGYQPGDEEWEKLGICKYITWPRTVCSIIGQNIDGTPLDGKYLYADKPMSDGFKANVAYCKLGFLDKTAVALGMQLKELIPVLWMKAGAYGPCPEYKDFPSDMLIIPENRMAVLINENYFSLFAERLADEPDIQTAFLITDFDVNYKSMVKDLKVETTYQLYRDYLDNFRINTGRNLR